MIRRFAIGSTALLLVTSVLNALPAHAGGYVRDIAFPVDGVVRFIDDYSDPRSGGRQHEGNDLMGEKMMPLLAAVDGRVDYLVNPEPSYGCMIVISDAEGWTYHYIHVNNDSPGTDDGIGCAEFAYAPGLRRGSPVTRGQVIAYMGDSGNAENIGPHLHFEMHMPDDTPISPYESLIAARQEFRYSPGDARNASPDINTDKGIMAVDPGIAGCTSGSRVKTADSKAVYYCGADGKRYVFPNDKTYYTWYADFNGVVTITAEQMAALPLGGNVTYRPGVKMIKITSDPRVYAVDRGGALRWVQAPNIAEDMYGANWMKQVEDVSDAFFINYTIGNPITSF